MSVKTWEELASKAIVACDQFRFNKEYIKRLKFELQEINKQGANSYWLRLYNSKHAYEHNKNGLIFPFLLGMTPIDPIQANINHQTYFDPEFPDIDCDLLPISRDYVKKYAEETYGKAHVCNVGLWLTYKAKLALQDAATVLGQNRNEIIAVCKNLPEEFDDMSYEQARDEYEDFRKLADSKPELVALAYRMIGKIKSQGKHAGGLIISNVPIRDYIPLTYIGPKDNKQWTTAWTEGMAATQLSKFGFVKFDLLGLLNISYIYNCKKLINNNRNIIVDFDDMDPKDDRAGWLVKGDGTKEKILFNDPLALQKADEIKLESIFQFDTDFAKSIVEKGGVRSFTDLLIYTSLGRPGPLPMIDVYIRNRDDPEESWKQELHPKMLEILDETKGILTYQEQLLRIWVEICGFTMPEAEAAQKAVKKKKADILNEIEPRVIGGAAPIIGEDAAKDLWQKMISFGRYCFNKSHAIAYMIIAYRCLWLKTHFPAEWWAAVLSECPNNRTVQYMGAARAEGIKFGAINVNALSARFAVDGDKITPGITGVKGIGDSVAEALVEESKQKPFSSLDDFVFRIGRSKTATERLIKLGGFDTLHKNRRALWMWFNYKYDSSMESKKLKKIMNYCYSWPKELIETERRRQIAEHERLYPKRKKIPTKILNWTPSIPHIESKPFNPDYEISEAEAKACIKIELSFEHVVRLFPHNYSLKDILLFEKEYLGYYWNSPLDMFEHSENATIEGAKKSGVLDCVIESSVNKQGARGEYKILGVTDGINSAKVNVWTDEILCNDEEMFNVGIGVRMRVNWQEKWRSFAVRKNTIVTPLIYSDAEV